MRSYSRGADEWETCRFKEEVCVKHPRESGGEAGGWRVYTPSQTFMSIEFNVIHYHYVGLLLKSLLYPRATLLGHWLAVSCDIRTEQNFRRPWFKFVKLTLKQPRRNEYETRR